MKNRGSGHSVSAQLLLVVMTLATAIAFFSVQSSSLTANAAVTVLPGNGGTLPLVNQLVIKQDDGAFQGVTTSAGSRATITPDDESQKVLIKDVKDSDTVTATYGTVGTFHGKAITAKVTYTHITNHNEDHKAPGGVGKNDVKLGIPPSFSGSILISNVAQTNVSYEFYYADTKAAVDIQNAFITLSSLDGPVSGTSTGFEYTAYLGGGTIYTVENSIVKQIANPLGGSQLVMAGQSDRDPSWPYASATGATFAVSGSKLDFIYGTTRVNNSDHWLQPVFAISTITLGAPAISAPTLSATQSDSDKQSQLLNYEVKQKVNVLDQDLMTKYKDWSEELTIPSNATYVDGEVVDDSGNALSKDSYQLAYDAATHKVKWTLTAAGIAKLPFKGETYHFKARVKFGTDVTDQSKVTAVATTVVDKQSKDSNTVSTTLANQREITLHHYMTDSTDKIAPDEKVKVSYGKPYSLKSKSKTVTGYKYNDKLDVATTGTATNKTDEATMYYDPLPYNVHVNYLLEDGQKLDELDVEGLYGDTYTTEATDFEDLYTLDTDRMPGNAQDTVTEKPITVNYYYKPTTGQWVDVGNQSSILTRKDYKNQVRSVSQNYANGSGFTVKYNMDASQVAITASDSSTAASSTSQVFDYGSKYTYQISKNEQMTFKVDDQGAVTVTRTLGSEQTLTTFDKSGKINTQTTTANNNGTLSKQVDAVDGLKSVVTAEKYDLNLTNGLKVVATKNINLDGTSSTVIRPVQRLGLIAVLVRTPTGVLIRLVARAQVVPVQAAVLVPILARMLVQIRAPAQVHKAAVQVVLTATVQAAPLVQIPIVVRATQVVIRMTSVSRHHSMILRIQRVL
ncbi:MucBP domain-containing protein [Lactiplantibacillus herbarum]|uniref:MucBP domain-containing protein n=1 Tax=Lactiplantibacillus herbarum TaxID=1670446 RepID=UPI000A7E63D3|nr:MucBP domain-containing protein [Lactiplantibacillus herbarum]